MADFLDRLVARSRVPAPPQRGLGRSSFAIEHDVVLAPSRPATAPVASPAAVTSTLPPAAAPAASPARRAPEPEREPVPAVVRVEVAAPHVVEVDVARPVAEPVADAVRVAPPGPIAPPPARENVVPARPRTDTEQQHVASERVVERLVEARTDVRTEAVVESRTECVTAVAPQVARPVTATQPRLPVSPPVGVPGADPPPPAVHIHIGRLDVRGADESAPAAPATPAPTGPAASILSLGDYLRGRAESQS